MGIFNAVNYLTKQFMDPVIGIPFRLHSVLVCLQVILVGLAVEHSKMLEHIAKEDVGVADTFFPELFVVNRGNEG